MCLYTVYVCASFLHRPRLQSWLAAVAATLQGLLLSAMTTQMAVKLHVFGEQQRLRRVHGEPNFFKYIVFFMSLGEEYSGGN